MTTLTGSSAAVGAYHQAVHRWLHHDGGVIPAAHAAVEADPTFAAAHALLALTDPAQAPTALRAAERCMASTSPSEYERSLVGWLGVLVTRGMAAAEGEGRAHLRRFPDDLLSVGLVVTIVERSTRVDVHDAVRSVIEPSTRLLGDDPYLLSLLGFVDQEQGHFDSARRLAQQALAAEPTSVTAAHLQAHVNLEVADHEHGLRWLDAFRAGMAPDSDYHHHIGWHAALHALALGDLASTRSRLVDLASPSTDSVRQVVDTGTLLLRCRLCGVVGAADDPTEGRAGTPSAALLAEPASMYLAFHVAVGLAVQQRADDLRDLARRAAGMPAPGVAQMLPDLARALADYVEGEHAQAADALAALRPSSYRWGGSRAQRDVVEDVLIDAALRAGRVDLARAVLTERLERRPSRWDASALARTVWHPVR